MTAKLLLVKSENGLETRQDYDGLSSANPAFTGTLTGGSAALTGSVDAGGEIKSDAIAGVGARPLVALADGTIDDQDAAAFRTTIGAGTSSLTLGETSVSAYRGDRGKTAYDHSQLTTGNPHGTTAADVGALAKITLTGTIDSRAINGGAPGVYELRGSSYVNFPSSVLASSGGTLLQTVGNDGRILQELHSALTGKMIQRQTGPSSWSGWTTIWDNEILPVSTTGLAVVTASSQAAARATISAAKAPSKADISASTTLGAIDATAIKVTATDVILTLSGGVNGQGWDIVCPTVSFGISIPAGVTLYAYNGFDIGPTTRAVGGGRGIRIVRIDAATWIAPNLTW